MGGGQVGVAERRFVGSGTERGAVGREEPDFGGFERWRRWEFGVG